MKTKMFKTCIAFLISISYCFGCGGGYDWRTYGNLFGPEVLSDGLYADYFVSPPYCDFCNDQVQETNLVEWQKQFPQIKDIENFREVLYNASYQQLQDLSNSNNPFASNAFAQLLLTPSLKNELEYILFAKSCEKFAVINSDDEQPNNDQMIALAAATKTLVTQALEQMKSVENVFIKQRYLFQAVRMNFYGGYNEDGIALVDEFNEALGSKESIYYRILAYKAGAMKLLGKKAEADLLFARIFNESDALRNLAYINFLRLNDEDNSWDQIVEIAKTPQDKASIWMLKNLYVNTVTLEALTNVYKNEVNSSKLELLTLKYLNDIESSIFIPYLEKSVPLDSLSLTYGAEDTWDKHGLVKVTEDNWWQRFWKGIVNFFRKLFGMKPVSQQDKNVNAWLAQNGVYDADVKPAAESNTIMDFKKFIEEVSQNEFVKNKQLYKTVYAYLNIMTQNYQEANDLLEEAKVLNANGNIALTEQIDYLLVLNETMYSTLNSSLETKILKYLVVPIDPENSYASYRRNLLLNELARRYLQNNDILHATYALSFSSNNNLLASALIDWYMTIEELEQLIEASASPQTELEKYWISGFYSKDQLLEIKGIKYTRMGMFTQAEPIFSTLQSKGYFKEKSQEESDDVAINTSFEFTPYPNKPSDLQYFTHPTFNKEIIKLLNAKDYLKVANGLYYSQYVNYSKTLWDGGLLFALNQTNYPGSYPFNIASFATEFHNRKLSFTKQYCTQYLASTYYNKAFEQETNKENKAQCLYLTKLALEKSYVSYYEQGNWQDGLPIFENLQKNYSDTKFYQEASYNCAYLKDFLKNQVSN